MKGDQMGILAASPTQRELPLSNQTRFSLGLPRLRHAKTDLHRTHTNGSDCERPGRGESETSVSQKSCSLEHVRNVLLSWVILGPPARLPAGFSVECQSLEQHSAMCVCSGVHESVPEQFLTQENDMLRKHMAACLVASALALVPAMAQTTGAGSGAGAGSAPGGGAGSTAG